MTQARCVGTDFQGQAVVRHTESLRKKGRHDMAIDFQNFKGKLPYSSELFGIYQPLLGWKSKQKTKQVHDAKLALMQTALTQMYASAPSRKTLEDNPKPVGPDDLLPGSLPFWLRTQGAKQFRSQALRFSTQHGRLPQGAEWEQLVQQTNFQGVLDGVAETSKRSRNEVLHSLKHESVVAGTIDWLSKSAPHIIVELLNLQIDFPALLKKAVDPLATFDPESQLAVLSPIGLVHLFRQYFFEFDSFLGPPVGHVWVSPGGSLELFEIHTRKTIQERQTEIASETTTRSETDVTDEDELSTAIAEQNSRSTTLGITATASGSLFGVVQASASASFGMQFNQQTSQENAHRHARQQSEKIANEIRRNFKTTFRTSVESVDTSSRRYVLQNTADKLVNYELRRKMRQVGVQMQSIGTQLCWQVYLDVPGFVLGVAEFVHAAQPEDILPGVQPPEAPVKMPPKKENMTVPFDFEPLDEEANDHGGNEDYVRWPVSPFGGVDEHENDIDDPANPEGLIRWEKTFTCAPPAGYALTACNPVTWARVDPDEDNPSTVAWECSKVSENQFKVRLNHVNFEDQPRIDFTVELIYEQPEISADEMAQYKDKKKQFDDQTQRAAHAAYVKAIRERIKLASNIKQRPADDLRDEERTVIFRRLLYQLNDIKGNTETSSELHLMAELIRSIFDVDKMLYFVAQEWWKPRKYIKQQLGDHVTLTKDDVIGWGGTGVQAAYRENYRITDESEPARMGASLGWLMQLDGDTHRNAFLNSPWVKAIIPIRPGREVAAIHWLKLAEVEGTDNLDAHYGGTEAGLQGLTIEEAILQLAKEIGMQGTDMQSVLATEGVFEHGFDPLDGGFRTTEDPLAVFDQWIEVLPTDQIVAVDYAATGSGEGDTPDDDQ